MNGNNWIRNNVLTRKKCLTITRKLESYQKMQDIPPECRVESFVYGKEALGLWKSIPKKKGNNFKVKFYVLESNHEFMG